MRRITIPEVAARPSRPIDRITIATMSSITVKPERRPRRARRMRESRLSISIAPVEVGFAKTGHTYGHRPAVTRDLDATHARNVLGEAARVVGELVLGGIQRDAVRRVEIALQHRLVDAGVLGDDGHAIAGDAHVRALAALNGDGVRAHEVRHDLVARRPHLGVADGLGELGEGDHGEDADDAHHGDELEDREREAWIAHEGSWVAPST